MNEIEEAVAAYLDCKRRLANAKEEMEAHTERLMALVKGVGGAFETRAGVKLKYTPATVNERFDWKRYLKDHPGAKAGYMAASPRKESLRVTEPKEAAAGGEEW